MANIKNSRSESVKRNLDDMMLDHIENYQNTIEEHKQTIVNNNNVDELDEDDQFELENGYINTIIKDDNGEDTNMCHYRGPLGEFDYDVTQFELKEVPIEKQGPNGSDSSFQYLHYIGDEIDGSKISVPEGIKDASFMFNNTNIGSAPKMPSSVKTMDATFLNCDDLKECQENLPSDLESMKFAFANCQNMNSGPSYIPSKVENMDYSFTGCAALQNTPITGDNVKYMNGAYADCKSLKYEPAISSKVEEAKYVTRGCDNIKDKSERKSFSKNDTKQSENSNKINKRATKRAEKSLQKERDRYEKSLEKDLERQSFGGVAGSAFAAMMQCHSLKQQGYGFFKRLILTHIYRNDPENTAFNKNLSSGVSSIARYNKGPIWAALDSRLRKRQAKYVPDAEGYKKEMLKSWDELHASTVDASAYIKKMRPDAKKDVRNGFFENFNSMEPELKEISREVNNIPEILEQHGMNVAQKCEVEAGAGPGRLTLQEKDHFSEIYVMQMQNLASYSFEVKNVIENSNFDEETKQRNLEGLQEFNDYMSNDARGRIVEMQNTYGLFSDKSMKQIDTALRSMGQEPIFNIDADEADYNFNDLINDYEKVKEPDKEDTKFNSNTTSHVEAEMENEDGEGTYIYEGDNPAFTATSGNQPGNVINFNERNEQRAKKAEELSSSVEQKQIEDVEELGS